MYNFVFLSVFIEMRMHRKNAEDIQVLSIKFSFWKKRPVEGQFIVVHDVHCIFCRVWLVQIITTVNGAGLKVHFYMYISRNAVANRHQTPILGFLLLERKYTTVSFLFFCERLSLLKKIICKGHGLCSVHLHGYVFKPKWSVNGFRLS
jgi:hypothetical protein